MMMIMISSYFTLLEVFKFIGRSSDHIIDGVGDGDEKLDVPEIMGKMEVGMLLMMMIMMIIMVMMMIAMMMKIGHDDDNYGQNDDDAYHLSLSYLCILQVTSLSGFPTLFAMMLTTQVSSAVWCS